ncbi:MAG: DUF3108 domain-containing protein [Desulfobacteraceae bacterium]
MAQSKPGSILERFLGEELTYQIGFWLLHHCGEARTRFFETERPGIYRASLEGRTLGLVDVLLGRYRYAYVSFLKLSNDGSRLRPLCFQLTKRRRGRETQRTVTFDYVRRELTFSRTSKNGETKGERRPMRAGIVYEDYLTLFYNFRYGCYGPLKRGYVYRLPPSMFIRE